MLLCVDNDASPLSSSTCTWWLSSFAYVVHKIWGWHGKKQGLMSRFHNPLMTFDLFKLKQEMCPQPQTQSCITYSSFRLYYKYFGLNGWGNHKHEPRRHTVNGKAPKCPCYKLLWQSIGNLKKKIIIYKNRSAPFHTFKGALFLPPTNKLMEGNVFTGVRHSVHGWGGGQWVFLVPGPFWMEGSEYAWSQVPSGRSGYAWSQVLSGWGWYAWSQVPSGGKGLCQVLVPFQGWV